MFLDEPSLDAPVQALYDKDVADRGWVMNLTRAWAWRPELFAAFVAARGTATSGSGLTERDIAVLVAATAGARGDSYCSLAWGAKLAGLTSDDDAAAVLAGADAEGLDDRERALAAWARHVVSDPSTTRPDEVAALRAAGLDDGDLLSATVFVALRLAFSTVNAALGVAPDQQLLDDAPLAVARTVDYGRPPRSA